MLRDSKLFALEVASVISMFDVIITCVDESTDA